MENKIFEKLNEIIENASSKYYNYPVAALLECNDGKLYAGVNVETSSPSAGICAERNAFFSTLRFLNGPLQPDVFLSQGCREQRHSLCQKPIQPLAGIVASNSQFLHS